MTYIALARKWRPRQFAELVGQEHVNKVLTHALGQMRLHHAYLFTGTRGVGKTSVARLFAKALNCEAGISPTPCLVCTTCQAIEEGHYIDLIEVDGASKTKVEDTRELLDNVQYAPTLGRFKIYLIDEVHMLSTHSFNALLKTLEEPPLHVKFLFATTDPQKLPITILSRCLQFHLKPIVTEHIEAHLQQVVSHEHITCESKALRLLAQAAKGSMRDALTLLEQANGYCEGSLTEVAVKKMLGFTKEDYALIILQALAKNDPESLLKTSRLIQAEGANFHYVLEILVTYLHELAMMQLLPKDSTLMTANPIEWAPFNQAFTPEDLQLLYQIALKGYHELALAPTVVIGFEMTLLRMYAFKPAAVVPSMTPVQALKATPIIKEESVVASKISSSMADENTLPPWNQLIQQLALAGMAKSAAENAELHSKSEGKITLKTTNGHRSLFTPTIIKRLEESLSHYFKDSISLTIITTEAITNTPAQHQSTVKAKAKQEALQALKEDDFFNQLQQSFEAEVNTEATTLVAEEGEIL